MVYDNESCQLLGPVSITIQVALGAIAVFSLLIKRNYEHPRRKLIVWCYDAGKQVSGALGIHFLNLGLSILKRRRRNFFHQLSRKTTLGDNGDNGSNEDDECDWYFLNLLLDTTIGIPILWIAFVSIEGICMYFKVENIESGNYFPSKEARATIGDTKEHKPLFRAFLKQLMVFTGGLAIMKLIIFLLLNFSEEFGYWFANRLLGWSDPWPNFQIFLVMFVSPILLNCFQCFCVDNIIKLPTDHIDLQNSENFEATSLDTNVSLPTVNDPSRRSNTSSSSSCSSTNLLPKQWRDSSTYGSL